MPAQVRHQLRVHVSRYVLLPLSCRARCEVLSAVARSSTQLHLRARRRTGALHVHCRVHVRVRLGNVPAVSLACVLSCLHSFASLAPAFTIARARVCVRTHACLCRAV